MQAMKERDDETPLDGYVQLDDVYWGGVHRGVRGRGAKGKHPFVAAVSMNKEGHPIRMRFSAVKGFKKEVLTRLPKAHLCPESLVISDGLACFRGVKYAESFHHSIVTGGGADCVELPYFKWVKTMIGNVKNAMHGIYHSINKNHLPRYLAEFCFKFNRCFNLEKMLEQLIFSSIQTAPMPQRLLKLAEARW